jgi:hypothetical protein
LSKSDSENVTQPISLALRFKKEWKVITGLRELKGIDTEVLEAAISPVVAIVGPRIRVRVNAKKQFSLKKTYDEISLARDTVQHIFDTVIELGIPNRTALSKMVNEMLKEKIAKTETRPINILLMLSDIALKLTALKAALLMGLDVKGSETAQPTKLYKTATLELLIKWMELVPSAKTIPWPHGRGEFNAHNSTEFVFQCLKMVAPHIKATRARRAIEVARGELLEYRRTRAELRKKIEADPENWLVAGINELRAAHNIAPLCPPIDPDAYTVKK